MNDTASSDKSFSWEPIGTILQVEGSAIMPGVFTGMDKIPTEFSELVVAKARSQLVNKPSFAYGHGEDIGQSQTVGFVTATDLQDGKLRVKGYIFDNMAIEDIKANKIRGMSIDAAAKVTNEKGKDIVHDFDLFRVALVTKPACPTCVIDSIKEVKQMSAAPKEDPKPANLTSDNTPSVIATTTTGTAVNTVTVPFVQPGTVTITPIVNSEPKVIEKIVEKIVEKQFSEQLADPKNVEELIKKFGDALSKTKIPAAQVELLKGPILMAFSAAGAPDSTLDGLWNSPENPWKMKLESKEREDLIARIKEKDKAFCYAKALEGVTDHVAQIAVLTKTLESFNLANTKPVELSAAPPAKDELKEKIDKASQALFGKPYGEMLENINKGGKK